MKNVARFEVGDMVRFGRVEAIVIARECYEGGDWVYKIESNGYAYEVDECEIIK